MLSRLSLLGLAAVVLTACATPHGHRPPPPPHPSQVTPPPPPIEAIRPKV
ncbi:hypothetical protein G5B46_16010 [Caulobacter sp. 602-2]|uniref:Uncharacterized protein n=1 Tax=Caulobacter sp. 602-2 TaxID=2710887 RepID=A0A6G4R0U4_9CAUL|nr:hypothetical protein [Caulobacter sp. 602-2]NGM51115.1 hypothetical protein [Caulobacter sp. 602-2]